MVLYFRPAIFDVPTNTVNLLSGDKAVKFDAKNCVCIIDPLTKEFYLYAYDPTDLSSTKLVIKPKTEKGFDL